MKGFASSYKNKVIRVKEDNFGIAPISRGYIFNQIESGILQTESGIILKRCVSTSILSNNVTKNRVSLRQSVARFMVLELFSPIPENHRKSPPRSE